MAKSSKRRQTNNTGTSAKKQLKRILAHANAQSNPLAALPSAFKTVNISRKTTAGEITNNDDDAPAKTKSATIHYYKSLPESILTQCLDLFEVNMGDMYRKSEWGLNMQEKREEMVHDDARFLVVILDDRDDDCEENDSNHNADNAPTAANGTNVNPQQQVIGFAHFRYEPDEDSPHNPLSPITYLYELQISQSHTSNGLGRQLMTLIELLSMQLHMTKVILTVFKCNKGAMRFYLNKLKGYGVDECSPSNFGEDDVDYEILSKRIAKKTGS